MPLLKRIGFYLIGLSLGLIFLAYFFRGKKTEFCYFPNCRVLKNINSKSLLFSSEIQQLIDNQTIGVHDIKNVLTDGKVRFSESNTNEKPCALYRIYGKTQSAKVALTVKNCEKEAEVQKIELLETL